MNIDKGLFLDGYVTDKGHGAWNYAKNILLDDGFKSSKTEEGFDDLDNDVISFLQPLYIRADVDIDHVHYVGNVSVKDETYLFIYLDTSDGDASCILKYDSVADEYEMILNLCNGATAEFYFDPNYHMDVMYTFTPDGELILAFCNGLGDTCIEPILMNVDRRNEFYLNENKIIYEDLLYLFNRTEHIVQEISSTGDGELVPGVYYITLRFEYLDGTKSNWCMLSQPVKLGSNPDKPSKSSINVIGEYTGLYGYEYVEIAYIHRINGQTKAYRSGRYSVQYKRGSYLIDGVLTSNAYKYTFEISISQNSTDEVDIDSLLIRKAFYRKGESIAFVDNKLLIGGVKEENPFLPFEEFAKDIVVEYDITHRDAEDPIRNTLAPGEVYAFYVYFILKDSGVIAIPYNIPGREDYFTQAATYKNFDSFNDGVHAADHSNTTRFDYSDFPDDNDFQVHNLKMIISGFNNTGGEFRETVTVGFTDLATLIPDIRDEISTISATYSLGLSFTVGADYLDITCTDERGNGLSIRYYLINTVTSEDETYLINEFLNINKYLTHVVVGGREPNAAAYRYLGYWENTADDTQRHHRMPSLKTLQTDCQAAYAGEFSASKFSTIKLKFSNINIPSEIADKVSYVGIAYAKRTSENKMFYGDSLFFNYKELSTSGRLYSTPLPTLLKDTSSVYGDGGAVAADYEASYAYLDNFDILNNNLQVKITNLTPEYTMVYDDLKIVSLRCTDSDYEYLRGTLVLNNPAISSKSIVGADYDSDIEVSANILIPHNSVIDPATNLTFEVQAYIGEDPRYAGRGGVYSLDKIIDNIGGQKHIFAILDNTPDHDIEDSATPSTVPAPSSAATMGFKDKEGTSYTFTGATGPPFTGVVQTGDRTINIGVTSIYSIKDDVYIDTKSQELIPLGIPTLVTSAKRYEIEIDGYGDITVGEKITLFTSDPFTHLDGSTIDGSSLSELEARNLLQNHVLASSFKPGIKIPFRHLTYGISDVNRRYRKDSLDSQSNLNIFFRSGIDVFQHNHYEEPTDDYENDFNSIQDLDTPVFVKERPEYNKVKIIRSTVYQNEDIDISALKSFLVDNYYIMPNDKQEIINIKELNNGLIIQQRQGLYYAFIKDYLDLQGKNAYLGTGSLFDRKPAEIKYSENNSISCPHRMSSLVFKYGYAVFDDYAKRLYAFDGKELHTLSNNNAKEYFRNNYDFGSTEYNPLSFTNPHGVYLVFDGYNDNLHIIKYVDGGTNNNLSFSFLKNNFLSFHIWIPRYVYKINDNIYSVEDMVAGYPFLHNSSTRIGLYYIKDSVSSPTPESSIVDIIFTGDKEISKLIESVYFESQAIDLYLGNNNADYTFDQILIYNDDQCSEYLDLNNPATLGNWFDKINRDVVKAWQVNKFRDAVYANGKMFDSDYEPDSSVVDSSKKNWFDKSVFKGKHIVVRMKSSNSRFSNGAGGYKQFKLILNNMNVNASISKR